MVTTGFGDIVPSTINETLWVIVTMYIGVLFTTSSIANLTHLMTDMDKDLDTFQQKQENLNKYMAYRNLPVRLRG